MFSQLGKKKRKEGKDRVKERKKGGKEEMRIKKGYFSFVFGPAFFILLS